uniref:Protein TIC 22, chloroplastic n=1 Tax=Oryza meridionalis TaxID=40149 RepID=A0A0E0DYS7_9ORYZ
MPPPPPNSSSSSSSLPLAAAPMSNPSVPSSTSSTSPLPPNPLAAASSFLHHHLSRLASRFAAPPPPALAAVSALPGPQGASASLSLALAPDEVARALTGTPVFTVCNSSNEFVLVSDPATGLRSLGLLCFRSEDADALLTHVRMRQPVVGRGAKVVPITLDQVYMLKAEGIAFRFLPDPLQIKNALELKSGLTAFDGVPVFQSDLLVVKKQKKRYCPIYFQKEDIERELTKASKTSRGSALSKQIMVGSLEDVLKKMEMNERNSGWDDLIFIPPGKSLHQHINELHLKLAKSVAGAAAAFAIPRAAPAFGVETGWPPEHCLRCFTPPDAPFVLGAAAAIHLGNTNSCIAGYDDDDAPLGAKPSYYQFCIPSWVALAHDNGTVISGEAAMNRAALSPSTAVSAFMRLLHRRQFPLPSPKFVLGDDFTARIVDHMVEHIKKQHGRDVRQEEKAMVRLRVACEHAKKALSEQQETLVQIDSLLDDGAVFSATLTRAKLEELNHDLLDRAMALVKEVVVTTGGVEMVDEVLVIGGSARIPKVRQLVKDYFNGNGNGRHPNSRGCKGPVDVEPESEPEDAVLRGAALLSRPLPVAQGPAAAAAEARSIDFDHWFRRRHLISLGHISVTFGSMKVNLTYHGPMFF